MSLKLRFGPFDADLHTQELRKRGSRLKLSGQPFEILAVLLSKPGQLVTRDELRAQLWPGDTFVDFDHSLNAAVNKLREALNDSAESPRYIETLPRRGYRFIERVESEMLAPSTPLEPATHLRPRFHAYAIGAAALLSLLFAVTLVLKKVSSNPSPHENFLAVQRIEPLTNLSDETSEPAFSPSGEYVAFHRESPSSDRSGIFVQSVATNELSQLTRDDSDCCPVWSPDGRFVAFTRFPNPQIEIYVVPFNSAQPLGNAEANNSTIPKARLLDTPGVAPTRRELAWSPDGKSVAFTGAAGLFLLSLENSSLHPVTQAPPSSEDWGPAFSADGKRILFVRSHETGSPDELMVTAISGNISNMAPTQITSEPAHILGSPQWSSDERSIIFASGRGSHAGLWRVSAVVRDSPVQINDSGWRPAVSPRGHRLAYQRVTRSLNIWQLDFSSPNQQERILIPSTSETDQGPGPQISPDSKKLVFMSDRSGIMEIWIADRDGGHPLQLTALGYTGTPRWSPDSQSLVFDVGQRNDLAQRNGVGIYTVRISGGSVRPVIHDEFENVCPSFSNDGKSVYFASSRTGEFQIWKVSALGGVPLQVTRHGGHASFPSPDGKFLYYAKTAYANPEIWQIPIDGGEEKIVSPLVRPATWASWSVVNQGIVFAASSGKGRPTVSLFTTANRRVTTLGSLRIVPFWLSASRDAKSVFFDQPGWQQAQIMLVENFD
jgi:Tol biopolymer transport system component/DNA-binding winged helix-turn-helix (wHTH) protein